LGSTVVSMITSESSDGFAAKLDAAVAGEEAGAGIFDPKHFA
jgi:hypothetical protein